MEEILGRARSAGASVAGYTLLRLPLELKALFREWLEEHAPQKASHVLSLVAQCHGGKIYDSAWSKRMVGTGPYADMLSARFDRACRRLGFEPRTTGVLDTSRFQPPPQRGDQLALF
jgi:DNA repair photolyase